MATRRSIKHKYDNDNDLFIVLGEITNLASFTDHEVTMLRQESRWVEDAVRDVLQGYKMAITVECDDVLVVSSTRRKLCRW